MDDQEAKQELDKLKCVIPRRLNKIKCWICGQWQSEQYTRQVIFNGKAESVCISCDNALKERDDALSMEIPIEPFPGEDLPSPGDPVPGEDDNE
jgi:hypothetical protein